MLYSRIVLSRFVCGQHHSPRSDYTAASDLPMCIIQPVHRLPCVQRSCPRMSVVGVLPLIQYGAPGMPGG